MTSWLNLTAIAVGGGLGALGRYAITWVAMITPGGSSMWGTTLVNVLGCGLLGGLAEYTLIEGKLSPAVVQGCRVGFLGSLTTFSTFAAESAQLAAVDRWGVATFYVLANLVLGWLALVLIAGLVREAI